MSIFTYEQSVSFRAVRELIVGGAIVGDAGALVNFLLQTFVPALDTSGLAILKCISKQNLIKIYNVVQDL